MKKILPFFYLVSLVLCADVRAFGQNLDMEEEITGSLLEEASSLFKQERYGEAKDAYKRVLEITPQNSAALTYLEYIDAKAKEKDAESVYREACLLYQNKDYQAAIEKFKEVQDSLSGLNEKNTPSYQDQLMPLVNAEEERPGVVLAQQKSNIENKNQLKLEEKTARSNLKAQVKSLYREGLSFYKNKNYDEAVDKFNNIIELDPQNKGALRYLGLIQKKLQSYGQAKIKGEEAKRKKWTKIVIENLQKEALILYKSKYYNGAQDKFQQVLNYDSDNRVALDYLKLIQKKKQEQELVMFERVMASRQIPREENLKYPKPEAPRAGIDKLKTQEMQNLEQEILEKEKELEGLKESFQAIKKRTKEENRVFWEKKSQQDEGIKKEKLIEREQTI